MITSIKLILPAILSLVYSSYLILYIGNHSKLCQGHSITSFIFNWSGSCSFSDENLCNVNSFITLFLYFYEPDIMKINNFAHFRYGSICLFTSSQRTKNLLFSVLNLILEINYCPSLRNLTKSAPSNVITDLCPTLSIMFFNLAT